MKRAIHRILLLTMIVLMLLGGCSGGGSSSGVPTITGTVMFIGGLVSGLSYASELFNGVTNENGEFVYKQGEEISFSLLFWGKQLLI